MARRIIASVTSRCAKATEVRTLVVALAIAALASFATSCGGGNDNESEDSGAVSGSTITIGGFGPVTGPVASLGLNVRAGARAYFRNLNAAGGINGAKVNYVWVDDAFDPTKAVAAARRLVEQHNVLAVAGTMGGPNTFAAMPFLKQRNVPLIAPYSLTDVVGDYEQFPNTYQLFPDYGDQFYALTNYAVNTLEKTKIAAITIEDPAGHAGADGTAEALEKLGLTAVLKTPFLPITQTDFASVALKLKQSGATAVTLLVTPGQTAALLKEAARIGYDPVWLVDDAKQDPSFIEFAGDLANGVYVASPVNLSQDADAVAELRSALEKYEPDVQMSYFVIAGWLMAKETADAMRDVDGELTAETLYESLNAFSDYENGFTAPLTYGETDRLGNNRLQILRIENGEYVPVGDFITVDR